MPRSLAYCIALAVLAAGRSADAAPILFDTYSTATQTLLSPLLLFGTPPGLSATLSATGTQSFEIDPVTGTAAVTSNLFGNDFLGSSSYRLYNTTSTGTVTGGPGNYDVVFNVLFELEILDGALAGAVFETLTPAVFAALDLPTLPFPAGTVFSSPVLPLDFVPVFVKTLDNNDVLAGFGFQGRVGQTPGTPVGGSFNRTVTINAVSVPEPGTLVLLATGGIGLVGGAVRKRRKATAV